MNPIRPSLVLATVAASVILVALLAVLGGGDQVSGVTNIPASGPQLVQGDNDCDGDVDSVDALAGLRHLVGFSVSQQPGCPQLDSAIPFAFPAGNPPDLFGDVDCDNSVDSVDQLKILLNLLSLAVAQNEPCANIGDVLSVGSSTPTLAPTASPSSAPTASPTPTSTVAGATFTPPPTTTPTPIASTPTPTPNLVTEQQELLTLINNYRSANGRGPVVVQNQLDAAADWFASDMATMDYFPTDYVDSLGRSSGERIFAFGFSGVVQEAIDHTDSNAQSLFNSWTNSPNLDEFMLEESRQFIGIGFDYDPSSTFHYYWNVIFGESTATAAPTPTPPPSSQIEFCWMAIVSNHLANDFNSTESCFPTTGPSYFCFGIGTLFLNCGGPFPYSDYDCTIISIFADCQADFLSGFPDYDCTAFGSFVTCNTFEFGWPDYSCSVITADFISCTTFTLGFPSFSCSRVLGLYACS